MNPEVAAFAVASSAIIGNRVVALLVGLCLKVPASWLLPLLIAIDVCQVPLYFWLYRQGSKGLRHLPHFLQAGIRRDWSSTSWGRRIVRAGGWGVMAVSAMPAFGGGIWSAALLSHNIGLSRREGALWLVAGSVVSYGILWSLGIGTLRIMRTWI